MYDPILLTLDGSPRAERAMPHAVRLAAAFDCRVIVLRVVPLVPADDLTTGPAYYELMELERREAGRYVERKAHEAAGEGVRAEGVVRVGDPASSILDLAAERSAKLIVTSSHGRSGLARWVFGSVAERVVRNAPCPVLVIRTGSEPSAPEKEARP